ncbi:MAG TPA: hypothetical protein VF165_10325 [Nocardioidaceae bacterium]
MSVATSTLALVPAVITETFYDGNRTRRPESHFLDFVVDGRSLRDITQEPDLVTELNRPWLHVVPDAVERLLGRVATEGIAEGRVMLLVCGLCGDLGCGAITALLDVDTDSVAWSDFLYENTYAEPTPVESLPAPLVFDRAAYEETLTNAPALVATLPFDEVEHARRGWLWPWQWGWKMPRSDTSR